MPDPPPNPTISSNLLTALNALLSWRWIATAPDGTHLGVSVATAGDQSFYMIQDSTAGTCAWKLAASLPTGFQQALMSQATYNVLKGGSLNTDGSGRIVYGTGPNNNYRVRAWYNGSQFTAEAVVA
jgi:hypothetical protein